MLNDKRILVTGGTGSFGEFFVNKIIKEYPKATVIIYSRDEFKQFIMSQKLRDYSNRVRFFIGDVRDKDRLYRAFEGVDYVVHAAALKHVPICEYNPFEAIKTNIYGAQNIIDVAIDQHVKKVIALSTDKVVNPTNLYGATKLCSDKLFISANAYTGKSGTILSVVRCGNIAGSRGSVIPYFKSLIQEGTSYIPITHLDMTRFWINLNDVCNLILSALNQSKGGETYIPKMSSFKITDLARAIAPDLPMITIGRRPGEKLHEDMILSQDSVHTYDYGSHYIIYPHLDWWNKEQHFMADGIEVPYDFEYISNTNKSWLTVEEMSRIISAL